MKNKSWYIDDNGTIGYKMGKGYSIDSYGDLKYRLTDNVSVSMITGEVSLNTHWGKDDKTIWDSLFGKK